MGIQAVTVLVGGAHIASFVTKASKQALVVG